MQCPRDKSELIHETEFGIQVDHCPICEGRWFDRNELDQLEATVASTPEERRATIEYGEKRSDLDCPVCGKRMEAFNYRAYDLELDQCEDEHGYWLDAGEDDRVRAIIAQRVKDLARSAEAEAGWGKFLGGLRKKK